MKITSIEIGEYRQFKNIKFDFTYPKGHPKEGQPLEKVCFIGQSGTGKTTLLNVITEPLSYFADLDWPAKDGYFDPDGYPLEKSIGHINYSIQLDYKRFNFDLHPVLDDGQETFFTTHKNSRQVRGLDLSPINKLCIYIKDSIAREADAFLFDQKNQPQTFSDFIKTDIQIEKEKATYNERIRSAGSQKVVSLGDMQSLSIWQFLLKEIDNYDEETISQITRIIQNTSKAKLTEEIQKWVAANPRIELAEKCLNPILNKFFLELDSDGGNIPIALRTKQGIKIDSSYLSTGTRQLLSTAIPIYKFDTKETVILFDEPERSLFPNIQRGLIDYYTSLAPEAQFFFATHSPIIASAFEPCERFILYFDENGEVKCRNGVAPIGDDPNDILSEDFGMQELMLQPGLDAYEEYRQLAMQIRAETDEEKKNKLIAKRAKLGDSYNF